MPLAACIAPLPVSSVSDPWVRGTIENEGVAAEGLEIWLDHDEFNACEYPGPRTITDADGKFSFEGKMRTWTWVGWANNHFVSGCILAHDGPRLFRIRIGNDPRTVVVNCDIAKPPQEMCSYSCDGGVIDDRC
jgi:hypothetical protein